MIFLGQASNFRDHHKTLKHFFARGKKTDSNTLRAYLAARYGTDLDHVALYHNGRTALGVALRAFVPEHSGIMVTGFTCSAVIQAIRYAKCIPIYVDIDPETLNFTAKELDRAYVRHATDRIAAVIVQNTLGNTGDIRPIEKFCRKNKLVMIEDLAHCTGCKYSDGREVGTVGRAACLSFGKGKSIDTISGGALIFNRPKDPAMEQPYQRPSLGDSARDRWYPVFGRQIRFLYHLGLGKLWTSFLIKIGCISRSADAELDPTVYLPHWQAKLALRQIQSIPRSKRGRPPIRDFYLVRKRSLVLRRLEKMGYILNDTWYDTPVAPARYYKKMRYHESECPVATAVAKHIINLPTNYPKSDLTAAYKLIKEYQIDGD